ncbi:Hypothetical predicted protein [Scomber scombrus]|uniref:Uncharacterized protein n=1 Tax=Scomber scombrus TaxID=13677 RepID=A0AAV1NSN9_SCOSC
MFVLPLVKIKCFKHRYRFRQQIRDYRRRNSARCVSSDQPTYGHKEGAGDVKVCRCSDRERRDKASRQREEREEKSGGAQQQQQQQQQRQQQQAEGKEDDSAF